MRQKLLSTASRRAIFVYLASTNSLGLVFPETAGDGRLRGDELRQRM